MAFWVYESDRESAEYSTDGTIDPNGTPTRQELLDLLKDNEENEV